MKYEDYKMNWMKSHGYTLSDMIVSISEFVADGGSVEDWEFDCGFNGEIWACFDEWLENEATEETGYLVIDFDGTGMLEIEKNDELDVFRNDEEATEAAIKDGIKIIPVNELPENFDRKYLGWIDTEENRERIKEYCKNL